MRATTTLGVVLLVCGCRALAPQPDSFRPNASRAAYYNARAGELPATVFEAALYTRVRALAERKRAARVRVDPALTQVAREYARVVLAGTTRPHDELLDFLLAHAGITEPHPLLFFTSFPAEADATPDRLMPHLSRLVDAMPSLTDVGIAALRLGSRVAVVGAALERAASLEPSPQSAPSGSVLPIRGTLRAGYRGPFVLVTTPSGEVRRIPATVQGSTFSVTLQLDRGRGVYTVEVLATGPLGPTVVSLFPVYCGVAAPDAIALRKSTDAPPRDPREAEARLLHLINTERARLGIPPLRENPRLAEVARAHSRDMVAHGFVGHHSPRTGSLLDRLRRAGLAAHVSLENIARNQSVDSAHRGLMRSPGHRRNILDPRVREIGVGVVLRSAAGSSELFATQNFILPIEMIDPLLARSDLWTRVREQRARSALAPLVRSAEMDRVADTVAQRLLKEGTVHRDRAQAIMAEEMTRAGLSFQHLTGHFFVTHAPLEALDARSFTRPGTMRAGIGVAQSPTSPLGDYAVCVVLLLDHARAP